MSEKIHDDIITEAYIIGMVAAENKLSLLSDGRFFFGAHEEDQVFPSFRFLHGADRGGTCGLGAFRGGCRYIVLLRLNLNLRVYSWKKCMHRGHVSGKR